MLVLWQQLPLLHVVLFPLLVAAQLHTRLAAMLWDSWEFRSRQQRRRWQRGRIRTGRALFKGLSAQHGFLGLVLLMLLSMIWCCTAARGLDSLGMEHSLLVTAGLAYWKTRCPEGAAGCFLCATLAQKGAALSVTA
jgi:hypothetical protein